MHRPSLRAALATSAAFVWCSPALAQSATNGDNDIIVTARRIDERLQDVPKVVNAVTSDDIRKNNLQRFEDVATIVPGLTLQNSNNGLVQNASLRGVSFDVDSGLPNPTVQFYLNDANINPTYIFQSMYDIGQIEVLRGPQGTLRGRAAPSGSITLTTKLPDLYSFGGYGEATYEGGINGLKTDYALNVPIVSGKLALRVAGTIDDNEIDGVKTVYPRSLYPDGSFNRTWSERASVRAQPIESLEINLMYERIVVHEQQYLQTASICTIDPDYPCGPGPKIDAGDRLSTVDGPRYVSQQSNIFNARVDWHIFGQKLSYVGEFALQHNMDEEPQDNAGFFNPLPGTSGPALTGANASAVGMANPYDKIAFSRTQIQNHEIRISNDERIFNLFDYVAGFMTVDTRTDNIVQEGGNYPRSIILDTLFPVGRNGNTEVSWFANLTAHPTPKLEISGGARYMITKALSTPLGEAEGAYAVNDRETKTVWTASASYHFSPDFMGYVNAGSSFRPAGTNLGFAYAPASYGALPITYVNPSYAQYVNIKSESSKSYEIGFKSQLFDRRLTINLDYYHQDYKNFQYVSNDYIQFFSLYFPPTPGGTVIPPIALGTANVPAKVDGVEGEIAYRFSPEFTLSGNFSYADGRITKGAQVPCTPSDLSTLNAGNAVALCPGGPTSHNPRFTASAHADYTHEFNDRLTGVLRGLMTFNGATPYNPSAPYDKQSAYALFNIYAGIQGPRKAWELTFFVKNLLGTDKLLATYGGNLRAVTPIKGAGSPYGPSGAGYTSLAGYGSTGAGNLPYYAYVGVTQPRQIGVTLRYSFGSR